MIPKPPLFFYFVDYPYSLRLLFNYVTDQQGENAVLQVAKKFQKKLDKIKYEKL